MANISKNSVIQNFGKGYICAPDYDVDWLNQGHMAAYYDVGGVYTDYFLPDWWDAIPDSDALLVCGIFLQDNAITNEYVYIRSPNFSNTKQIMFGRIQVANQAIFYNGLVQSVKGVVQFMSNPKPSLWDTISFRVYGWWLL